VDALRTILVPVDFTRASITAFDTALRFRRIGTDLFVVHVLDQAWIDFAVELGYRDRRRVGRARLP
jgi:nucleotide-binding universal stress UspA family protein